MPPQDVSPGTAPGASDTLQPPVLALRPSAAAQALGLGRSLFYELIRSGEIETITIGRCRLVPIEALRSFLARRRAEAQP